MPMFLFWSQVSNCWWLCELSSHLFRLPRVGHIPSQKLVLPRQDQSPPSIGPLSPVLLSHWRMEAQPVWPAPLALFFNCAMVYKFLSNSFPSCNSREISRSWSENIQNQVSKSGPLARRVSLNFCQKTQGFPARVDHSASWWGSDKAETLAVRARMASR